MNESTLGVKDENKAVTSVSPQVTYSDYGIMPLASSTSTTVTDTARVCECAGSVTTSHSVKFKRSVLTYNTSNGSINTASTESTVEVPSTNQSWTASGAGFSCNKNVVSYTNNPNESSRSGSHILNFNWRGTSYTGTINLTQDKRKLGHYEAPPSAITVSRVTATAVTPTQTACTSTNVYINATIHYDLKKTAEAYDTCGLRFESYDRTCTGTSAVTVANANYGTFNACANGGSHTQEICYTSGKTGCATATVVCPPSYSASISKTEITYDACWELSGSKQYPSITVSAYCGSNFTKELDPNEYKVTWYGPYGNGFTDIEAKTGTTARYPDIWPKDGPNYSLSSRTDRWDYEVYVGSTFVTSGSVTVTQGGGCYTDCEISASTTTLTCEGGEIEFKIVTN